jgi:hypothetical protein
MYVVKDTKLPRTPVPKNRAPSTSKPKKKREVLSAEDQNRKIAEIEGMLDNYDKRTLPMKPNVDLVEQIKAVESDSDEESDDESSDSD